MANRIVILGAGFGGISAVKTINAAKSGGLCDVTVIDRSPVHQFTPLFYEVATAFVDHDPIDSVRLLRQGITVDSAVLLAKLGANFVQAEVEGVDWGSREVLTSGRRVPFDYLIVALGAEIAYYGIPGLKEHSVVMKTVWDADAIRLKVHDLLYRRERGEIASLDIVVGGAGATGVEFATELSMFLRKHLVKGHLGPTDFSVSLVEARSRILNILDPSLSEIALKRLESMGIAVHLDTKISAVEENFVRVCPRALEEGEHHESLRCRIDTDTILPASLIVWTGGVQGNRVLAKLGVPLEGAGGRIRTDECFRIPGREKAFAIGDAVEISDPATGRSVPWLAPAAIGMGKVVGRTIRCRVRKGGKPDSAHVFKRYPIVVTVGGKFGVAEVGPLRIKGTLAYLLRKAADLQYFMSILSVLKGVRLWWHGVKMYSRND